MGRTRLKCSRSSSLQRKTRSFLCVNISLPICFSELCTRTPHNPLQFDYTLSFFHWFPAYVHDMFAIAPITCYVSNTWYCTILCTHGPMTFWYCSIDLWKQLWVPGPDGTPRVLTAKGREKLAKSRCWLQLFWLPFSVSQTPCLLIYVTWNGWLFKFETSRRGATLKKGRIWVSYSFSTETVCLDAVQKVEGFTLCRPCPIAVRLMKEGIRVSKAWHCHDSVRGSCSTHRGSSARSVSPAQSGRQDKWRGDRTGESLPSLDHDQ